MGNDDKPDLRLNELERFRKTSSLEAIAPFDGTPTAAAAMRPAVKLKDFRRSAHRTARVLEDREAALVDDLFQASPSAVPAEGLRREGQLMKQ
jgi:hypothetical protein